MKTRKNFEGYVNIGDINYMEHGGNFIKQLSENEFYSVSIKYIENENMFKIEYATIDITDTWINKVAVMSYAGMDEVEFKYNKSFYVSSILSYYGYYNCNGNEFIEKGIKKAYSALLEVLASNSL